MPLSDRLSDTIRSLGYSGEGLVVRDQGMGGATSGRTVLWEELQSKAGIDGAFFRGATPVVGFAEVPDHAGVAHLHKRLWNLSRLPLLIVATPDDTSAFSCYVPPESDSPYTTRALLKSIGPESDSSGLAEFSRFQVEAGRLALEYRDRFRRDDRVDRKLFENLRELRSHIHLDSEHARSVDALIGRTIFVRYLEDRGILGPAELAALGQQMSAMDILRRGSAATYSFFGDLAQRFNGDVFSVDGRESDLIDDATLVAIADFFAGTEIATGQGGLWPYDFSVIPPEMISSIYEQLLEETQKEDAAYYTPRPVVDLILDECLPWSRSGDPITVLDPACGSGIFLAEAFRRLARALQEEAGRALTFAELSDLLVSSIFGIDHNPRAIAVSAFGLYLALLEEFDPPTVWQKAKLPQLVNQNLIVADFFAEHALSSRRFDAIVGNPPWKSSLTESAESYVERFGLSVPDRQIAWAFLLACSRKLAERGVLGLLVPAKAMLHNKSKTATNARRQLMQTVAMSTVVDLSILRRDTFSAAVAPAAVLIARERTEKGGEDRTDILHVVPKGSPLQRLLDGFVVSHDDVHRIPSGLAIESADIWKVLLWGDLNDYALVSSLRARFATVGSMAESRGWVHSRGFQLKGGGRYSASHLRGRTTVPATAIEPFRISEGGTTLFAHDVLHRPRDPQLFDGPVLLVRRGLRDGRPAAVVVAEDAAFNDSIIGFSAPHDDIDQLRLLAGYINSSVSQYYHFLTSSSWGVERDYIEENEHLSLPFPDPPADVREHILHVGAAAERSGLTPNLQEELDRSVFAAYGLTDDESARVRDMVTTTIDQFRRKEKSSAFKEPSEAILATYRDQLRSALGDALPSASIDIRSSTSLDHYVIASCTVFPPDSDIASAADPETMAAWLFQAVEDQDESWPATSTVLQPSLLVLQESAAYIVKPKETRYWTVTRARDDAGELIAALAGLGLGPGQGVVGLQ